MTFAAMVFSNQIKSFETVFEGGIYNEIVHMGLLDRTCTKEQSMYFCKSNPQPRCPTYMAIQKGPLFAQD